MLINEQNNDIISSEVRDLSYLRNQDIERRAYSRLRIDIPCVLYVNDEELNAKIINISEAGVLIKFDTDNVSDLFNSVGNVMQFSCVDTYCSYIHKIVTKVVSGEVRIVRQNGSEYIGCEFIRQNKPLCNYINDKKITAFVQNGFRI